MDAVTLPARPATMLLRLLCAMCALPGLASAGADAATLQPRTVAAFDRYVDATEARIAGDVQDPARVLWLDTLPADRRRAALEGVRRGELAIERLRTTEGDRAIEIPGGLVHHWMGVVFVPGVSVDQAVALLQDYDRHAAIYSPAVERSRLLSREGDTFRVFLRFFQKKVIAVVVNTEHEARFTRLSPAVVHSRIASTRIAEVEHAGTSREREKPVGHDGGYLWRLNTYWRFVERDGGVYVQCESVSLTRGIPPGFGWLIGPFVTSIPRESLAFTLETTRRTLAGT